MVNIIASYTEWWPVYHNGEQIGKIVCKTGDGYEYSYKAEYNGEYYASNGYETGDDAFDAMQADMDLANMKVDWYYESD